MGKICHPSNYKQPDIRIEDISKTFDLSKEKKKETEINIKSTSRNKIFDPVIFKIYN